MSMTPAQIQTLGDLNFLARTKLSLLPGEHTRLMALAGALKAGTYRQWQDGDRSVVLGLMAATSDGIYEPNRNLIYDLASEIGVTVAMVTRPGVSITPAPAPPTPPVAPGPAPLVPAPAPGGDFSAAVLAVLRANDINIVQSATGVKVGIGMEPLLNINEPLQIGDRVAASIYGLSNTRKTDRQNPDQPHGNSLVIADNDGGMRLRQYMTWAWNAVTGQNEKVRNTTNRPGTIVAIDSMGDLCGSDDRIPYGQVWYLVKRIGEGVVDFCSYQIGIKLRLRESRGAYAATDVDVIDERIRAILAERGL